MNVQYKPIAGIPCYYACSDGTIWKNCKHRGFYQRKPDYRKDGYIKCAINVDGKTLHFLTHRLIAMAFLGKPEQCNEINHKDGNKHNNAVSNLEWVTRSQNISHAHKHLNAPSGDARYNAKFSNDEVRFIRKMHRYGLTGAAIFRMFTRKIRQQTIYDIINMKKYKHVPD